MSTSGTSVTRWSRAFGLIDRMSAGEQENHMASVIESVPNVLYTARTHTTGGRERGVARSDDGRAAIDAEVDRGGVLVSEGVASHTCGHGQRERIGRYVCMIDAAWCRIDHRFYRLMTSHLTEGSTADE